MDEKLSSISAISQRPASQVSHGKLIGSLRQLPGASHRPVSSYQFSPTEETVDG